MSIVLIAILATIGGATGWEDIEFYGESHQDWLGICGLIKSQFLREKAGSASLLSQKLGFYFRSLETFLDLRNGVPHADTYRRVFERIHLEALQQCFLGWVNQVVGATGAQVIPIDG